MTASSHSSKDRPGRREAVPLGDAVRSFLRASGLAAGMRHLEVFQAWDAVLGRELARRARPVGFQSGALHVEVQSSAHLHELQNFTGESFRVAANERLGRTEIRKVVFRLKR